MAADGFVVFGTTQAEDAFGEAGRRGWGSSPAPEPVRAALGALGPCRAFSHPDAPLTVVVVESRVAVRAVGSRGSRGAVRISHDASVFADVVDDCPVVADLVSALGAPQAAVSAA